MISYDDFDTQPPSNSDDSDIAEGTVTVAHHPKTTLTDTSARLILLESLRTRLRIVQHLNGIASEMLYDEVITVSTEIGEARRACRILASVGDGGRKGQQPATGSGLFRQNLNYLLLSRFLLPLHRPFADRAVQEPLFFFSRKVSLDCAMAVLSPEGDEDLHCLLRVGGGFIKTCVIYACMALCFEVISEFDEGLNPVLQGRPSHRRWWIEGLETANSLAYDRMRLGETNVRLYLALNMVLADAQAMESAAHVEISMVQREKEALERSYVLLLENFGSTAGWETNNAEADETTFGHGHSQGQDGVNVANDCQFDGLLTDADAMDGMFGGFSAQMFRSLKRRLVITAIE